MKRMIIGALAAALLIMLTACSGSNRIEKEIMPYPVAVGNVTVTQKPQKVATLSKQFTNILEDLGYGDRVAAVSSAEASGDEASGRAAIGSALAPNLDAIREAAPDILFTTAPMTKTQLDILQEAGIQVAVMPAVGSLDELYARYYDIIAVMDGKIEADTAGTALVEAMKADVERITGRIPAAKKSFLFVCTIDPFIATPDTFEGMLLSLIGENAAKGEDYTVAEDALAAADPDVIFFAAPLEAEHLKQNPRFQTKRAVTEEALYAADRAALNNGTKSVIEQLEAMAKQMYPDVDFSGESADVSEEEPE